jgi:hypothetical protein
VTKHHFALPRRGALLSAVTLLMITALPNGTSAQDDHHQFDRNNLIVSRSVYDNLASNVTVGVTQLPPNCVQSNCVTAVADGSFPYIFNNAPVDSSFGITSRIFLDEVNPSGHVVRSLELPNSLDWWINPKSDQLVTSFSSKSEMGLHLSTDGRYLTFMGYVAPVNTLDVSNSNTPLAPDPTNPVPSSYYRAVARMDRWGHFDFTETNAYSGNNGRSAILNNTWGNDVYFTAGNAGNGSTPQPQNVVLGAGAQILSPVDLPESDQAPGLPTPVGSFSVTELGDKADKVGKDDNFRGITIFNNVLYFTKGSGGNGANTVYYVNTSDTPCTNGVGIPAANATLPTTPLNYSLPLPSTGLPNNMCVLAGFPTLSNKNGTPVNYPFSLWFADANTLYVADEGDGTPTYDAPRIPTRTRPHRPTPASKSGSSTQLPGSGNWPTC